jgi:Sodium:solute symporter family
VNHLNSVTFVILIASFLVVTYIGFASARWRPAEDPMQLNEWGLGGRGFGTFVSWFLLGGDIYTAYTFIAVPALVYATGAAGFYALSYTIMVWPIVFVFGPRLWSVARARGYVSPGEFVRGRHGSQGLGLAVAATGILATMPYIALQLVGIESVLTVMGIGGTSSNVFVRDLPLIIAFTVMAGYTYLAGLRAPALIAFVKDTLIYVTVIVAILYIPAKLGGWGHIFGPPVVGEPGDREAVRQHRGAAGRPVGLRHLALGSALALFVYPHAATGLFAGKRRDVIRRNAALLPAYSLVLGLIALFGYMARSVPEVNAGVAAAHGNAQLSVPLLFAQHVPQLVRGHRRRGHRHRRAGARGHHVDRRGQPVHPHHLQGTVPAVRHPGRGDPGGAAGLAADEGRRPGLRPRAEQDVLDQPAVARRHLDPPDVPLGGDRPVHAVVPPGRADLGLGRGDGLRHVPGVPDPGRRAGALRRLGRACVRAHHLHRDHRAHRQPGCLGGADGGVQEVRPAGRLRRDQARGLHLRPGARACRGERAA